MNRSIPNAIPLLLGFIVLAFVISRMTHREEPAEQLTYSQLIDTVEQAPGSVGTVLFSPKDRSIEAVVDGEKIAVNYPSDESQIALQETLEQKGIVFDSKGRANRDGDSSSTSCPSSSSSFFGFSY